MRIVGGKLGGRSIASPKTHKTHPMSEKGRGALFNVLGDIAGLTILDAFAGSGALSFEALSRGAAKANAIDNDRSAQRTIEQNATDLELKDKFKLIRANAASWLNTTSDEFDIVLLDPPYDNLQVSLLERLARRARQQGMVVISQPNTSDFRLRDGFDELANKNYGDGQLVFYRRIS